MAERSPVVSVELTLDAPSDTAMRADWAALQRDGLSSAGAHPSSSNRPHLSLAVRSAPSSERIETLRDALGPAAAALPIGLRLAGLVVFPHADRVVLARAVVPAAALVELHAAVDAAVQGWGEPSPRSRPGEWMPHLTLARRLRRDDLPRALALLAATARQDVDEAPVDLRATATGLRIWDGREQRVLTVADP